MGMTPWARDPPRETTQATPKRIGTGGGDYPFFDNRMDPLHNLSRPDVTDARQITFKDAMRGVQQHEEGRGKQFNGDKVENLPMPGKQNMNVDAASVRAWGGLLGQ
jgi:hypothetical protein